jgi:hypothetical protein
MTNAWQAGFRLAWSRGDVRVDRVQRFVLILVLVGIGLAVRRSSPLGAVDTVLSVGFGFVVPLAVFTTLARASGAALSTDSAWPVARFGFSRRAVAFGIWLSAYLQSIRLVGPGIVLGAWFASLDRAQALRESATACGLVLLATGAYLALFVLAGTFLRRGRGRYVALGLDFLVGSGSSALALPFPRAHLQSLLGGPAVAGVTSRESSLGLALGLALALLVALRRIDD